VNVLRRILHTLADDARHALFSLIANTILGSALVPRVGRILGYRLLGMSVGVVDVFPRVWFKGRGVELGSHVTVNSGTMFDTSAPVTVGARTRIGFSVLFCTSEHSVGTSDERAGARFDAPITVGEGCWIGSRALLLPGVSVGDGCVIAAGAVVARDCESNGLYAGVPARRIRELT
jgi:acetyltransferase-like isoleucine patch superfamily enzyme